MPNNVTIKDMVEVAQQFNQNYFNMDKKQQRELKKYIKETRPAQVQFQSPAPSPAPAPPAQSSESDGETPPTEAPAQSKPTWRSYIRLASQELKSPDSEVRATLSNIQKRARELALNDGYVFKNQK